jgi:PIN domain nuclease of toxin-antitoxin system
VRILLDTCTFLWIGSGSERLSREARDLFGDPSNEVWLSAASAWEIAVKSALGRLPLPGPVDRYVPALREELGVEALPISEEAALMVASLPPIHRDPFDRILVGQALVEGLLILTPDEQIAAYPVRTRW